MIYSAHTNPQYTVHNLGTGSAQVVGRREWTECIFFSISTHLPVTLLKFLKEKAEMTAYLIFIFQRRMVYSNLVSLNVPDKCCSNIITLKHKSYIVCPELPKSLPPLPLQKQGVGFGGNHWAPTQLFTQLPCQWPTGVVAMGSTGSAHPHADQAVMEQEVMPEQRLTAQCEALVGCDEAP